eukprot:CAMPEP_0197460156 /NCGR_PEP_ID=MMETSP1175-20131217/53324_1 /TAXON_ID=1003142 /ORGANISM="Triceratium dubium, Strain CCMP147" /LENGTH=61 /DNA_ID=CAMNT_0042995193 /DNA_START=43 /DNA_END=225 /DNA_ORIENTATION=+
MVRAESYTGEEHLTSSAVISDDSEHSDSVSEISSRDRDMFGPNGDEGNRLLNLGSDEECNT